MSRAETTGFISKYPSKFNAYLYKKDDMKPNHLISKWLTIFLLMSVCTVNAQKLDTSFRFYSFTNNRIVEITKTADSVIIYHRSQNKTVKMGLAIVSTEKKGKYNMLYFRKGNNLQKSTLPYNFPTHDEFGLITFYLSDNSGLLHILIEKNSFQSLTEAVDTNKKTAYEGKYFTTWYSEKNFANQQNFRDFKLVTKSEANDVTNKLIQYLKSNLSLIRNTKTDNISNELQDNMTKALIDYKFNPRISITEFSNVLDAYQITLPSFRGPVKNNLSKANSARSSTSSPVIDMPRQKPAVDTTVCGKVILTYYFPQSNKLTRLIINDNVTGMRYIIDIGSKIRLKFEEVPEVFFKGKSVCISGKLESGYLMEVTEPSQIVIKQ